MKRKRILTWVFVGIILLIIAAIIYYFIQANKDKESGEGKGDANIITQITGGRCTGITKDMAVNLQTNLNQAGCKDLAGNILVTDGTIGPKTFQALQGCIAKKIIG